jgi:hypothetical protein
MSTTMNEYELESELEDEWELESETEGEDFFRTIANLAQQVVQSEAMQEAESESEGEFEDEWEEEANPQLRAYPDALMEHLGHMAAETESEAEAEAFIGAIPLALQAGRALLPLASRAAPHLIRSASRLTRALRRNPRTRKLVRTVPTIIRRTNTSLRRQAQSGRRITPQTATRTFQQQARQVIGNPAQCAHAWRNAQRGDRRYHRMSAGPAPRARTRAAVPGQPAQQRPPRTMRPASSAPVSGPASAAGRQYCICCGQVNR